MNLNVLQKRNILIINAHHTASQNKLEILLLNNVRSSVYLMKRICKTLAFPNVKMMKFVIPLVIIVKNIVKMKKSLLIISAFQNVIQDSSGIQLAKFAKEYAHKSKSWRLKLPALWSFCLGAKSKSVF